MAHDCNNIQQYNSKKLKTLSPKFKLVFGVELSFYFDIVTGFNIDKFQDFLKSKEPVRKTVGDKYGIDGLTLLDELIFTDLCD